MQAMWELSQLWYGDRLSAAYRPQPVEALQAMLPKVGLTDPFWQLSTAAD